MFDNSTSECPLSLQIKLSTNSCPTIYYITIMKCQDSNPYCYLTFIQQLITNTTRILYRVYHTYNSSRLNFKFKLNLSLTALGYLKNNLIVTLNSIVIHSTLNKNHQATSQRGFISNLIISSTDSTYLSKIVVEILPSISFCIMRTSFSIFRG